MTTLITAKLKKTDDQTNIDKYRVAANITEYYIISKSIILRIIIPKFMMIRQSFHVKNVCKCQKSTCLKWTYGLFGHRYEVAMFLYYT